MEGKGVLFGPRCDGISERFEDLILRWKDLVLQGSRRDGC